MHDVRLFENEQYGQVRVIMREEEPWFVAADVCRVLEIQNATQAVSVLDDDERAMYSIGRQGEANLISESGLYSLIFRSKKKEAKAFRRWVTHEVLPTLRRNGAYALGASPEDPQGVAALIQALQREQRESKRLRKQLAWEKSSGAKRLLSMPAQEDDHLPEQCVSAFLGALQKMMDAGQVPRQVLHGQLCVTPSMCARVEEQLREEGQELPITRRRLYQALKALGAVEAGQETTTQVKYMDGKAVRVLVIPLDKIDDR